MDRENQGINNTDAVEKKMEYEELFSEKLKQHPELESKYGKLLTEFCSVYGDYKDYLLAENKIYETYVRNLDFVRIMSLTSRLQKYMKIMVLKHIMNTNQG
ncbi:MAG: S46 family peptidase [Saprospiraceae bacterium]